MKKILTILLIILSANAFAQKGFYLKPVIGSGISKLTIRKFPASLDRSSGFCYKAGINVGYHFKTLGIETGLNYTSMAYKLNNLAFENKSQPLTGVPFSVYDATVRFNYITLPISVNYVVSLINKLSLQPQIGFALNYNLNGKATYVPKLATDLKLTSDIPRSITTCSGNASILLQYKLSNKLCVAAGPALSYIYSDVRHIFEHSYSNILSLTLDAGITMKL